MNAFLIWHKPAASFGFKCWKELEVAERSWKEGAAIEAIIKAKRTKRASQKGERQKQKNIFNAQLLGQMNKLLVIRIYFNAVGAFGAHVFSVFFLFFYFIFFCTLFLFLLLLNAECWPSA